MKKFFEDVKEQGLTQIIFVALFGENAYVVFLLCGFCLSMLTALAPIFFLCYFLGQLSHK